MNNDIPNELGDTERLKAVIDNITDGIITISDKGLIDSFNYAATNIFGYNTDEVIGQNVKILMPEPFHTGHDGYLHHHKTTGEKNWRREKDCKYMLDVFVIPK